MKEYPEKNLPAELQKKDNVNYTLHNLDLIALAPIDCKIERAEIISKRCFDYFETCMRNDMKPSVAGFALCLGVTRPTLLDYINGVTPIPKENREVLQRFYGVLNALIEDYIQNGKVNPVAGLFLTKNNFGYKDTQEFIVNNTLQEETTPESLIEEANLLFETDPKQANIETE